METSSHCFTVTHEICEIIPTCDLPFIIVEYDDSMKFGIRIDWWVSKRFFILLVNSCTCSIIISSRFKRNVQNSCRSNRINPHVLDEIEDDVFVFHRKFFKWFDHSGRRRFFFQIPSSKLRFQISSSLIQPIFSFIIWDLQEILSGSYCKLNKHQIY